MKYRLLATLGLFCCPALCWAAEPQFHPPVRQVFKGLGGGKFAKGTWLQADGKAAEVPGVW
jgi:hypothetical protein